ncbi:hypothetical protein KJ359_002365 [Pestalotiopsis sp. 9143b]|nr:hypothetical protein KJ359_002365 [Pestalotiopsis sp. 9143b]
MKTACYIAWSAIIILVCMHGGGGTHQWDVTLAELFLNLFYGNISQIIYCVIMLAIKYALLQQIKTIFLSHDRRSPFRIWINIMILLNAGLFLGMALAIAFRCTPQEKIWHPWIEGTCFNEFVGTAASSSLNAASDVAILIVPMVAIWRLRLPLKKKIRAASPANKITSGIVAAITRLGYSIKLFFTEDQTWAIMPVALWAALEATAGFMIAGAPYVPHLFDAAFFRKKEKPYYDSQRYQSQNSRWLGSQETSMASHPQDGWTELSEPDDMRELSDVSLDRNDSRLNRGMA